MPQSRPNKRAKGVESVVQATLSSEISGLKREIHSGQQQAYSQNQPSSQIEESKFPCKMPNCNKTFSSKAKLDMHLRLHDDYRPFECPQNCGMSFKAKGNMLDHLRRHYAVK